MELKKKDQERGRKHVILVRRMKKKLLQYMEHQSRKQDYLSGRSECEREGQK